MIEVELSDGTVLEFPDGMTRDQIKAAIDKQFKPAPTRNPDGTYGQVPEGYQMDPETGQMVNVADRAAADQALLAERPVASRAVEVVQGLPFVGEWIDEGVEQFSPRAARNMRAMSGAMEREHPIQSGALNVAGAILATAPVVATNALNWVGRGANTAQRAIRAGAVAAPAGAVEGASTFAGRARSGERLPAAVQGAVVGGALGALLGPISQAVGEGVKATAQRLKKLDVRTISEEFGLSMKAARVVKGYLANDDLDAASRALAQRGDDALLAEAGPATRQALDTAMSAGGEALTTGRRRVTDRVRGAGTRFSRRLTELLGDAEGGIKGTGRQISRRTARARQAAYDRAYAQPTPMTGEAGAVIDDVLRRVDPRTMQSAVDEANAIMRHTGATNQNIMASIDEAGNVTFTQPLSVMQLDHLARGLAKTVDDGTDKITGQVTAEAARAGELARQLRDAMKESVPGYDRALRLGGDKIRETNALVMGRKLLSETTTVEDVVTAMRDAPRDAKAAARKGLRENIEAIMGRARATIDDLDAGNVDFEAGTNDVAQAVAAVRNLTTPNNMKKVRAVLGKDADALFSEINRMGDAMTLRAAVARNSATAIRQAGQEAIAAETAPGAFRQAVGELGSPLEAGRPLTRAVAGTDAASVSGAQQRLQAEIADALTRIRGPEAQRALSAVEKAMSGQPLRDEEAALIGRLIGPELLGVGGHQSGQAAISARQ